LNIALYLVDEALLPPAETKDATPESLSAAIRQYGAAWGTRKIPGEDYARLFEILDNQIEGEGFLPEFAVSGSPYDLLSDLPGTWRLGYFDPSLVHDLYRALGGLADEVERALESESSTVSDFYEYFFEALSYAHERNHAVAIVHE
jgi:hypothetical protein